MSQTERPHLRSLDFQPIIHRGERMWLLRDPWQLSNRQIVVPPPLAQLLLLCDGTRTPDQIHAQLCRQFGAEFPFDTISEALAELDASFLLHNARFEAERQRHLELYRAQPFRPPALARLSYPASADELNVLFANYDQADDGVAATPLAARGIVSPHIDYQRGGPVYARVWRQAAPSVLAADLVLIFGTDHNGRPGSVTLTRQPFATPYGLLPTDTTLIDNLADAVGPEAAYAEELNHRQEHSIELSAVWLHHVFAQAGRAPCPMVPVLIGSFHHFLSNGHHPANDATLSRFLDALRQGTAGRRVLIVGSVDLAHVGPAFGDPFGMDAARREHLRVADADLMQAILRGDAADFYRQIYMVQDRNRICGFAPLYLMLRFLESTGGVQVAYDHCPADATDTSLVSICGLLLA